MANVRWLTIALAAIAVFGVMAAPALAGGGVGIGGGLAYQCYLMSDKSPGQTLEIIDDLSGELRTATVGNARLVCARVAGELAPGSAPLNSGFVAPGLNVVPDFLKCYDLRSSAGDNPAGDAISLSDAFQDETFSVGGARFLCVVAVPSP